eukprot:CAMPEP_0118938044 /NCGR_PEP_ID=MMETSP1169-20130426/24597_1 /TAXON_ID=36882 /ORGANISM="Pyramimonas obovata, Strain CCMP722" /LENGTH=201 /DNA_ID=CAMNT_0006881871 /DNA_START=155 /DNA_END=760 /DNA_ORIENTATION=-
MSAQRDAKSGDSTNTITRRRVIALAEVSLELSVATWCELNFRPKAPGDVDMTLWESLVSLLPYKTPQEARIEAQAALERGRSLAAAGEHASALEQFDLVLTTAPRQYTLCQAAFSARFQSASALKQGGGDGLRQWLWGRGVRFPGHYILCYILARPAFTSPNEVIEPDKKTQQAALLREGALICALAVAYNYLLFMYGLEY